MVMLLCKMLSRYRNRTYPIALISDLATLATCLIAPGANTVLHPEGEITLDGCLQHAQSIRRSCTADTTAHYIVLERWEKLREDWTLVPKYSCNEEFCTKLLPDAGTPH